MTVHFHQHQCQSVALGKNTDTHIKAAAFRQPYANYSGRAKEATTAIRMFIAEDMRPYSNAGFENTLQEHPPCGIVLFHPHFT